MTKVQLKNTAIELMLDNKASKKLTEAVTELLEAYTTSAKIDTVKRAKNIELNGETYTWCNRHEVYEVSTNFKKDTDAACKLANKKWQYIGHMVNAADKALEEALEAQNYDDMPDLHKAAKDAKAIRAGRYTFADDALQFADIEGFNYEEDDIIQEDEA